MELPEFSMINRLKCLIRGHSYVLKRTHILEATPLPKGLTLNYEHTMRCSRCLSQMIVCGFSCDPVSFDYPPEWIGPEWTWPEFNVYRANRIKEIDEYLSK